MEKQIEMDYYKAYPKWKYTRVDLVAGINFVHKKTDFGFNYLLHGIVISYPDNTLNTDISPYITVSLIQPARFRELLPERDLIVPVMCAPAGAMPGNRDRELYLYYSIDYLYDSGDIVKFKLDVPAGGDPAYARILFVGRNLRYRKEY